MDSCVLDDTKINMYKNWILIGHWFQLTNKNLKFHKIIYISWRYSDEKLSLTWNLFFPWHSNKFQHPDNMH